MKKLILAIAIFLGASPLWAELMTYQGRLKESNVPVTGNRLFTFEFCDAEDGSGLCLIAPGTPASFAVANGLFKSTITVHPNVDLAVGAWYLRVTVGSSVLTPLERLTAVPYSVFASSAGHAAYAANAASADGTLLKAGDTMTGQLTVSGSTFTVLGPDGNANGGLMWVSTSAVTPALFVSTTGRVGVGTAAPGYPVHVVNHSGQVGLRVEGRDATATSIYVESKSGGKPAHGYVRGGYLRAMTSVNPSGSFQIEVPTDPRLTITPAGLTGIGTETPNYQLHVSSAAGEAGTLMAVSTGTSNLFWVAGDGAHATRFHGDGSGLTGVTGATGTDPNALQLTGGTLTGPLAVMVDPAVDSFDIETNGITISTSGAIVTRGVGLGTFSPNTRGRGAVDLQTARNDGAQVASGEFSTIGGGQNNAASGFGAALAGGHANTVSGNYSFVGGGVNNNLSAYGSVIAGGQDNQIDALQNYSAILGGSTNKVHANFSAVGGGQYNVVSASNSVVAGGVYNLLSGTSAVVAGGEYNSATGLFSSVGGGKGNTAGFYGAVAAGGTRNTASGSGSFVGGGDLNLASRQNTVVAGGIGNKADGNYASVGGGIYNIASGYAASIQGGYGNVSGGNYSWAGGYSSSSPANGSFTWSDSEGTRNDNTVADRAVFKSRGGFIVTGSTSTSMAGTLDRGVFITGNGLIGVSTGAPQAALDVVSTGTLATEFAQIWRNSAGLAVASVTATGRLYTAQPLPGDNLGNHNAVQDLQLNWHNIYTVSTITAAGHVSAAAYQISGSTVLAVGSGSPYSLFVGMNAGRTNTGSSFNTLVGNNAGYGAGGATFNRVTAVGADAGVSLFSGGYNSLFGVSAGYLMSDGGYNTMLGALAGYSDTSGSNNVMVGHKTGYFNTTGSSNTLVGDFAGYGLGGNSFSDNSVFGANAGYGLTTGSRNILIGVDAGRSINSGSDNLVIGNGQGTSAPGAGSELNIGGVIFGSLNQRTVGISTRVPQAALDVVSTGTGAGFYAQIWRNSSGVVVSSVNSLGVFYGNGSGLTGVTAAGAVQKTGDSMQGTLDMNGNFLAGVSTITMLNGSIAIVPPGTGGTNHTYGISIGSNVYSNYDKGVGLGYGAYGNRTDGVGIGYGARTNEFGGVGIGAGARSNSSSGVGAGYNAYSNSNYGVGVGAYASDNFAYGVGLGAYASSNDNYAVGVGAYSQNNAGYGAALGAYSYASSSATALGSQAKANAELSLALGYGTVNNSTGTASFGNYAVQTSSSINAAYYQVSGSTVLALRNGSLAAGPGAGVKSTGLENVFVGAQSGGNTLSGDYNAFLGYQAGLSNTVGYENTFLGNRAGRANTTGLENTLVGVLAGSQNQTGSANTSIGYSAGYGVASNSYSSATLVGSMAGYGLTTGDANIFIGYKAGYSVTTGTGNIVIGFEEDVYTPTDNNVLNIGGVLFGELAEKTIGINSFLPSTPVKPQAALDVISTGTAAGVYAQIWRDSDGVARASVTAAGVLYGDGSGLRNVAAAGAVKKVGDVMTGPLFLDGSGGSDVSLRITRDSAGDLITAGLATGATAVINVDASRAGFFTRENSHRVAIGAGMTEALTVTQNRVGANNTSPYYTLDVNGPGRFSDQVIAGGSVTVAGSAFSVGASTFVVNAGRVGINWITPEAALQVSGGAKFLSNPGTSYILTAGSAARPDMFFVSSGGAVGMGDFTGVSVDTASAVQISARLTGATNGTEDVRVGLFVENNTDGTLDSADLLVSGNFEATVRGADAPSLVSPLRLKVRRESSPTGNVDRAMGLFIDDLQNEAGGTINNTYGIFIGDQSSGSQNNDPYALFSVDPNARSYFAGSVGIARTVTEARLDLAAAGLGPDSMGQIWRNFDGTIVSSVSATGVMMAARFVGDGGGLYNIPGVQKTGDTMTGQLTMAGSSITIRNSFGYEGLEIRDPGGAVMPELRLARDAGTYWDIGGAGGGTPLVFQYGAATRLFLASDGHLTVNDAGQVTQRLRVRPAVSDAYSLYISSADGVTPALTLRPGGELYMAGRMGVGSAAPAEALDVSGRVLISTRAGGNEVTDGLLSNGSGGMEFYSGGGKYMKVNYGGGYIGMGPSANVYSDTMSPKLQVKGSVSVGSGYNTSHPPADALVVQGRLGAGTPSPDAALSVVQSDVAVSSYTVHIGTSVSSYHLVVTTAGWVGLNTRQPQAPLHLTAATKDEGIVVEHNSDTSEGSYLALLKARGSASSQSLVAEGDNLGVLAFGGYNNTPGDPFPMAAAIVGRVDGTPTVSAPDMPGRLEFMTAADNTNETVTRMVIRGDGGVGIATGAPQAMLDIRSTATVAQVWRDSGGVIRASMTAAGAFYANIPGLTNKVSKAGDFMTGPLSITADVDLEPYELSTTGMIISTSGALQTQGFGDGTAVPNPRGMGAVDLQTARSDGAQVAAANFSVIGGGAGNTVPSYADYAAVAGGEGNSAYGNYSVIAGGKNNYASNYYSVVGGGVSNIATSVTDNAAAVLSGNSNATRAGRSVIAGGSYNLITATSSFVGGGGYNVVHGTFAVIAGGEYNAAAGLYSAAVGGRNNAANGLHSFLGGGYMNVANGEKSVLGGGTFNTGDAQYGVIAGGYQNKMQSGALAAFIGAGKDNTVTSGMDGSVIVGGSSNTVSGLYGFIGGGGPVNIGDPGNKVLSDYSIIVGGSENLANADAWMSFIGGGSENVAAGQQSVVAGGWMNVAGASAELYAGVVAGWGNRALGGASFVGAGGGNRATGDNSVIGGGSSNMATGGDSTVPGGSNNTAKGAYSFAAGFKSSSTAAGTFTWADSQGVEVENAVQDQVRFKARGGFVVSGSTSNADPKFTVTGGGDALLDNDRKFAWGYLPAPYITGNDGSDLLAFGLTGGEKMKLQSGQLTLYNANLVLSTTSADAGIVFPDGSVQKSAAPKVVSVYKPANEIRTLDAAATPDTHLQFFVGPNEKWAFEFNLYVYTTDTTGAADMRVGLVGPAATQLRAQYDLYAENGLTVNAGGVMGTYGEYVVNWTGTVPGVGTRAVVKGTIENSTTGGTVAITWGQGVSTAVNTNVLKGSYLIAHKLN